MIKRKIESLVARYAAEYPAVTVLGPRQAGKSTTVRELFPRHSCANLEVRETRLLAESDARAFFSMYPPPVIIDEVQTVPDLLGEVQAMIDADRRACGRFILTGSHQSALSSAVSQTLAGRTAIADMMPLAMEELPVKDSALPTDALMLRGFMPEVIAEKKNPVEFYRFYYRTYVERDIARFVNLRHKSRFEKFMVLLAGRVGQLLNLSSLAAEVGVSSTTLEEWLSVLEASYVCFRLRPFFSNVSKRMVKTPKLYFHETGLACHLLGISTPAQLMRDPLRGSLFENMVVAEAFRQRTNAGREPDIHFLRTSHGFEIDLAAERADGGTELCEIKSAMSFSPSLTANLDTYLRKWDDGNTRSTLVYDGKTFTTGTGIRCVNFRDWKLPQ